MFETVAGAGGTLLRARPRGAAAASRRTLPAGAPAGFTDEEGRLLPAEATAAVEPEVRARARAIAARLALPRPQRATSERRPGGRPLTLPYRGGSDDIDLDRTLESLAEHPFPEDRDIFVRERARAPRSVVLAVDLSGSMKGERVRGAAATVGALAAELERDALAVVAFWSDAALLLGLGDEIRPSELLDTMLRIPAQGLTNVAFPLRLAAQQLAAVPERGARVLLLSDCVHNAGPDPRPFAARLPRLDVLLDASGEKDEQLGAELARAGRGTFHTVRTHHDIAPALSDIFRT